MVSHKNFKSRGLILRFRNSLDIKSEENIYYSLIFIIVYLTYSINVWSSTYRANLETL